MIPLRRATAPRRRCLLIMTGKAAWNVSVHVLAAIGALWLLLIVSSLYWRL